MPRQEIGRQAVQLVRGRSDRFAALLNIAAELERQTSGFLVEGLQMVARRLVLVHAGKPVAEQRALDIVLGCGVRTLQANGRKRLINLAVKAEGTARQRHPLGLRLCLVAHRLVRGNGVQNPGLRPGQAEMLKRLVVEAERVFRGSRTFNRQKCSQG